MNIAAAADYAADQRLRTMQRDADMDDALQLECERLATDDTDTSSICRIALRDANLDSDTEIDFDSVRMTLWDALCDVIAEQPESHWLRAGVIRHLAKHSSDIERRARRELDMY